MPAELLHATRIRIARETSLGSGVETGGWRNLPVTGAAVERELVATAERRSLHGQLSAREVISDSWRLRTSSEGNLAFFEWLLTAQMNPAGSGIWILDPETIEDRSYVVETMSELGDVAVYRGTKLTELQIFWEERRIVQMETEWSCLERDEPGAPISGAEPSGTIAGEMLPTRLATIAITGGAWGGDPRADNAVLTHAGQLVMTRQIEPRNFGPDGIPDSFSRGNWSTLAEIYLPETAGITDVAFADEWTGGIAFWFGAGTEHLRINRAHGLIGEEDLKAYDWRVRRLTAEAMTDDARATLEFRT